MDVKYKNTKYRIESYGIIRLDKLRAFTPKNKNDCFMPEVRYYVIDTETDQIVDDCNGYGYKSVQTAYNGFSYKQSDRYKQQLAQERADDINNLAKHYPTFAREMDKAVLNEVIWGSIAEVPVEKVSRMIEGLDVKTKYTAEQILDTWREVRANSNQFEKLKRK